MRKRFNQCFAISFASFTCSCAFLSLLLFLAHTHFCSLDLQVYLCMYWVVSPFFTNSVSICFQLVQTLPPSLYLLDVLWVHTHTHAHCAEKIKAFFLLVGRNVWNCVTKTERLHFTIHPTYLDEERKASREHTADENSWNRSEKKSKMRSRNSDWLTKLFAWNA